MEQDRWDRRRAITEATLVVIFAVLISRHLFTLGLVSGHDALSYPPYVAELFENLRHGILIPRWAPHLSAGFGQPLLLFRPPLFGWLAQPFLLVGTGPIVATQGAAAVLVAAAALGMFFLGNRVFGRPAGLLTAFSYVSAPYFLTDLYVRSAYKELSLLAVAPWVLLAAHRSLRSKNVRDRAALALAFALALFAHNAAPFLMAPLLMCFVLADRARGPWVRAVVIPLILGLALATVFWLPAVALSEQVHLERAQFGWWQYFNAPDQVFYTPWGFGATTAGTDDQMPQMLGPAHCLATFVVLGLAAAWPRPRRRLLFALVISTALSALLTLSVSEPLWRALTPLQALQFPWRFLGPATLGAAVALGVLPQLLSGPRARCACAAGVMLVAFLAGWLWARSPGLAAVTDASFSPWALKSGAIEGTTRDVFESGFMARRPAPRTATLVDARAEPVETSVLHVCPEELSFVVERANPGQVTASSSYFPGWRVEVDGAEVASGPEPGSGLVRFALPAGKHVVRLLYGLTPVEQLARGISLLALFVGAAILTQAWLTARRRRAGEDGRA